MDGEIEYRRRTALWMVNLADEFYFPNGSEFDRDFVYNEGRGVKEGILKVKPKGGRVGDQCH